MAGTKKQKKMRTVIVKARPVAPFDLTNESPEERNRIILALESLKVNAGWIFLMQLFAENKRVLAEMIIEKKDIDGKAINEEQADEARYKHGYLKELMDTPEKYINQLTDHKTDIDENDPYDQGNTQKDG